MREMYVTGKVSFVYLPEAPRETLCHIWSPLLQRELAISRDMMPPGGEYWNCKKKIETINAICPIGHKKSYCQNA